MKATGRGAEYKHIIDDTPIDLYQIENPAPSPNRRRDAVCADFEGKANRSSCWACFLGRAGIGAGKTLTAEQEQTARKHLPKSLTDVPAEQAVKDAMLVNGRRDNTRKNHMSSLGSAKMNNPRMRPKLNCRKKLENIDGLDIADFPPPSVDVEEPGHQ